jgi:metal-sulfur cluster biosynthetic enzyme
LKIFIAFLAPPALPSLIRETGSYSGREGMNEEEIPMTKHEILRVLDHILDPDLRNRSIVEMGFVKEEDIEVKEEEIQVFYTVGGPLCPYSAAVGIIIHHTLSEKFHKKIKVRMKAGHYQQDIVNQILQDESQFNEWFEKIKSQKLLEICLRA